MNIYLIEIYYIKYININSYIKIIINNYIKIVIKIINLEYNNFNQIKIYN